MMTSRLAPERYLQHVKNHVHGFRIRQDTTHRDATRPTLRFLISSRNRNFGSPTCARVWTRFTPPGASASVAQAIAFVGDPARAILSTWFCCRPSECAVPDHQSNARRVSAFPKCSADSRRVPVSCMRDYDQQTAMN